MEDAATAEISRAQVWQWRKHGAALDDGRVVDAELIRRIVAEELQTIRAEVGDRRFDSGRFALARDLFLELALADELADFLTLGAYAHLWFERGTVAGPSPRQGKAPPGTPHPLPALTGRRFLNPDDTTMDQHSKTLSVPRDRWQGIERPYASKDVERLRPSVVVEHTLARLGAERLWQLLHERDYVNALGALTGNQAVQQVRAGLEAIYLSGWQVAADANLAGQMYPDQSLYPADSVPAVGKRINNALLRAGQIERAEPGETSRHWRVPIVADAEAGFGGPLNAFELMKAMIEAGAAAVHFEDQLAAEKKCGHLGGKVLVPTSQFI